MPAPDDEGCGCEGCDCSAPVTDALDGYGDLGERPF